MAASHVVTTGEPGAPARQSLSALRQTGASAGRQDELAATELFAKYDGDFVWEDDELLPDFRRYCN